MAFFKRYCHDDDVSAPDQTVKLQHHVTLHMCDWSPLCSFYVLEKRKQHLPLIGFWFYHKSSITVSTECSNPLAFFCSPIVAVLISGILKRDSNALIVWCLKAIVYKKKGGGHRLFSYGGFFLMKLAGSWEIGSIFWSNTNSTDKVFYSWLRLMTEEGAEEWL